jgi:predicted RecB family nuclease
MNQSYVPMLSKSRFLAGLHCPLNLWYQCYNRDLASEASPAQQAIFDMGHEVGRLATQLYQGGVLIKEDHMHHREAVQSTLLAMKDPNVGAIYEAAFISDGVRIRVDILERLNDGAWNLIEVKSATSVKDLYLPDVAVQYHVLRGSGLNIRTAAILHLNNQYVYDGKQLDLNGLFTFSDLAEEVLDLQNDIPSQLAELNEMLAEKNPPEIYPSKDCISPYKCGFWEHCTAEMPKYWVMRLGGLSQTKFNQLVELGIEDIAHIPDSFPLSALQSKMRTCVANREWTS